MLSKKIQAIPACLLIVTSFVFVYIVHAAEDKDPPKKDSNTSIQVTARLTKYNGGVTGYAHGASLRDDSYGSMYLYATVAMKEPKSKHFPYYGIYSQSVTTDAGANNRNNQASAVGHDYYNNQHVNALVRGKV